jgi:hypothetical protein
MKKLLIILALLTPSTYSLYAQNKIIKGRVINDDFVTTPGVFIMINDTVKVGETDLNGFFQIEIPISVKKILFKFLALDPAAIYLTDECNEIEVVMISNGSHDFMSLKKVDRLRMKRFKQLPELHKEAFQKGIFKTEKACYTQDFIPYYKPKQR